MAKRKQAMVMSIDERQMILLCPDGSWKAVRPEPGRAVGDIIRLDSVGWSRRWSSLVAAILVIVTLAATSIMLPARQAMAHVSLDGVPGVDLVTNGRGTVLGSTAATSSGEELLAGLSLRGRSLTDAVAELLAKAQELDLLPEEMQFILVAVTPAQERISDAALRRLHAQAVKGVQAALQVGDAVPEVEQLVVSQTLQVEADALGLSAGQYALALKAVEAGVELDLSQIEDGNVAQALKSQGLNLGQMVKQLKQNQDLDQLLQQNKDKLKSEDKPAGGRQGAEGSVPRAGNDQVGAPAPGQKSNGQAKPAKNAQQTKVEQATGSDDDATEAASEAEEEPGPEEPDVEEQSNRGDDSAGNKGDDEDEQGKGSGNRGNGVDQVEAGSSGQEEEPAEDDARSSGSEDETEADNTGNGNKDGKDDQGGNGKGR